MAKYVKLGPKAGGFTDPYSLFNIHKGVIKKLDTPKAQISGRIKAAIRGGHLVACTEKEYKAYKESLAVEIDPLEGEIKTLKDKLKILEIENNGLKEKGEEKKKDEPTFRQSLEEMTREALDDYYEDSFEVGEDEIKIFKKLKHEEKVTELLDLEKDNVDNPEE